MTMESISLQLRYHRCQQPEAKSGNLLVLGPEEDTSLHHVDVVEDPRPVLQSHLVDEDAEVMEVGAVVSIVSPELRCGRGS